LAEETLKSARTATSDKVLAGLFAALVLGSAAALAYDFRSLLGQQQAFETGKPVHRAGACRCRSAAQARQ
jgi:cobalamin biosynthesis protein CobD/CbiB